jgi:hypothetical protein
MSFFKNKHVVTAMIVAPILAIASYYLVDLLVREQPQAAVAGQAYPLIAKSNCRYTSGRCDLENANFKSSLTLVSADTGQQLQLTSNHPLEQAQAGFVMENGDEIAPVKLTQLDATATHWGMPIVDAMAPETTIRVALRAQGTHYFAETSMAFGDYQTTFNKDFRK